MPRQRLHRINTVCLSAAALALSLSGETSAQQLNNEAAQRLKAGKQQQEEANRREQTLKADVSQLDEQRGKLNLTLQDTARLVQQSEAHMSAIEARQDELDAQQKMLEGSLIQRKDSIISLLSAMQSMSRNPPPVIITRRQDALEMVRSAMLLARAHPELQSQADQLVGQLTELTRVMADIRTEKDKLQTETQRLRDAQTRLASLMEVKRQTLTERQKELDEVRKEAGEIAQRVSDVSQLIAALNETVARRTGLDSYDKEVSEAGGKGQQVAALMPPKSAIIEMAPGSGVLAGPPGRMKPAIPFQLAKAQLPLPAQGRRVVSFGDTTSNGRKSQGIVIETRYNAQVTAPCDGWIVYAGEFRSYGQLLIINAGAGYHVLLAGLSHIDAQLGQFVLAGEPVGTMSAAPKSKPQDNAPVLYIEFRKEGRPTDPDPWWYAGQQKVQG